MSFVSVRLSACLRDFILTRVSERRGSPAWCAAEVHKQRRQCDCSSPVSAAANNTLLRTLVFPSKLAFNAIYMSESRVTTRLLRVYRNVLLP